MLSVLLVQLFVQSSGSFFVEGTCLQVVLPSVLQGHLIQDYHLIHPILSYPILVPILDPIPILVPIPDLVLDPIQLIRHSIRDPLVAYNPNYRPMVVEHWQVEELPPLEQLTPTCWMKSLSLMQPKELTEGIDQVLLLFLLPSTAA